MWRDLWFESSMRKSDNNIAPMTLQSQLHHEGSSLPTEQAHSGLNSAKSLSKSGQTDPLWSALGIRGSESTTAEGPFLSAVVKLKDHHSNSFPYLFASKCNCVFFTSFVVIR